MKTLGCKANRYESDRIAEKYGQKHNIFDSQACDKLNNADLIIVNTCTVTHVADRKSRQAVSHLKSLYPGAKVVVFGCGANVSKEDYENLENIDYVVQSRAEIDTLIEKLAENPHNCTNIENFEGTRTRSLIKIQDGCNNFCSYCIIPYARGRQKSRSSDEILEEINNKCSKDYKEIVLTGINIGEWKEGDLRLADLIEQILDKTHVKRLRLSSIEPQNFSDKFLKLFQNRRFCRHLHVSLQSGSDSILKLMRRRYGTAEYSTMVEKLRKAAPDISITTDVIVGFPSETEKLFKETLEFVKKMNFSKIHIFPYSKRKGTPAAEMKNQVPYKIKKDRCKKLSVLEKEMRKSFYKKNLGRSSQILIETKNEDGTYSGFTGNYIKTRVKSDKPLKLNTISEANLQKVTNNLEMSGTV
jgi:threonylcarbamoyladenosine tRNA methylthiotransferase MtaB